MKPRPELVLAIFPLILASLLVSSATALPVLELAPQSNANYGLNLILKTTQSCTATPGNFSGIACQNSPRPPAFVQANDDGHCTTTGDTACSFTPGGVSVQIGGVVVWQNFGKLNHTVVFSTLSQNVSLRAPTNSSPIPYPSSITFQKAGTYSYLDPQYPWMTGTVTVNDIPAPAPIDRDFSARGPVNWTTVGLDNGNALLSISHNVKVYNTTAGSQTLLASESGILEDSINLATRVESADLTRILSSLPYEYGYGYGYGPPPGIISGPPSILYPSPYYTPPDVYTVWWINGPLVFGSTVEVLTATGSVRGSETLNLGSVLGSQDAWIVGSVFKEQYSQPPPIPTPGQYPVYFQANNSIATTLRFDYGKASDLLLATSDNIDQLSQSGLVYPTGSVLGGGGFFGFPGPFPGPFPPPFFGGGGITLNQPVTVIRTQETAITLSLNLVSTNIKLDRNASPPSSARSSPTSTPSPSSTTNPNANPNTLQNSLIYAVTGMAVTALIGSAVWLFQRSRKARGNLQVPSPPFVPTPAPPV